MQIHLLMDFSLFLIEINSIKSFDNFSKMNVTVKYVLASFTLEGNEVEIYKTSQYVRYSFTLNKISMKKFLFRF